MMLRDAASTYRHATRLPPWRPDVDSNWKAVCAQPLRQQYRRVNESFLNNKILHRQQQAGRIPSTEHGGPFWHNVVDQFHQHPPSIVTPLGCPRLPEEKPLEVLGATHRATLHVLTNSVADHDRQGMTVVPLAAPIQISKPSDTCGRVPYRYSW